MCQIIEKLSEICVIYCTTMETKIIFHYNLLLLIIIRKTVKLRDSRKTEAIYIPLCH